MSETMVHSKVWERFKSQAQARVLAETDEHIERITWDAERIASAQQRGLRRLLAHAVEHSAFHRRRLSGIDLDMIRPGDLTQLPVMTKAEMMAELDDVFTDRRLNRAKVEEALAATTTEPVPIHSDFITLASGGSSGHRGVFVFDLEAMTGFMSSLSRSLMAKLQALGGPPPGGFPIAMVAAPTAVHATGAAPALTDGPEVPFRFLPVPVTLPLPEIVARLNELQAPALYSYPSMLTLLAAEKRAGRLVIAPLAVTSTSETLLPEAREVIRDAFGVPVVDTFGSTEGLVGVTAPDDDVLVFNTDMCIIELVDDQNQPVAAGTPSAKVLVTNLYNLAQPLIRYELTDSFIREPDAAENGHLRARVEGRSDEVLRYEGADVHPLAIRSVMVKSPQVADYQVRQTPRGLDIDVVGVGAVDLTDLTSRVTGALASAGLSQPAVNVRLVDALHRHEETGKLRRFVPLAAG